MNLLSGEDGALLSATAAAELVLGRPVDDSTVRRWRIYGLRGVKLETAMAAGRRVTTEAAVRRFLVGVDEAKAETAALQPRAPTNARRSRSRA